MSGIVGYVGVRPALEVLLSGLNALAGAGDDRPGAGAAGHVRQPGYDSAGVALLADGGLAIARTSGTLDDLAGQLAHRPPPSCALGLGHLRTATVGGPVARNAHPHLDGAGRVAVVHNGTLDNGAELRAELTGHGHRLTSDTDSEALAFLLAETFSAAGELGEATRLTALRLEGDFAFAAVHADDPEALAGARRGLPLLASVGEGEAVLSSGAAALPMGGPWRLLAADSPGPDVLVLRRHGDELTGEVLPS